MTRPTRKLRPPGKLRPTGPEYDVTDAVVAGLESLIASGVTQVAIARELSKAIGYDVDPSSISNIRYRKHPTSRLARDLAVLYGWPLPPKAGAQGELSDAQAKLDELHNLSPGSFRLVSAIIDAHLTSERNLRGRGPK